LTGSTSLQIEIDGRAYPAKDLALSANSCREGDFQYLEINIWTNNENASAHAGVALNCIIFPGKTKLSEIANEDLHLGDEGHGELGESVFVSPDHDTLEIEALTLRIEPRPGGTVLVALDGYCHDHFGN